MADYTGMTATGKGGRIELKRRVKCNFIKLRTPAEEESRKMPAFPRRRHELGRRQEPAGRDGRGPEQAGVPPGDRNEEPAASVEAESTPAEENAAEMTTGYPCGCRRPMLGERRAAEPERPPAAPLRAVGGYDSH